ncbi:hypothetical protein CAAN1_04S08152 [[Candida] anglica]|uniref:Zinc finger PHD-type domain-containing protein n=1 Tax=[Candida] anglica TaxID=148631 RepID=A0ABP0E889_9ASCO
METVISVIQHSSSINNAFISTVDHLPCDVIRSLWLIQSCNIASNTFKNQLNELIKKLQNDPSIKNEVLGEYFKLKAKIRRLNEESVQESKALYNQLITHKISLKEELKQLDALANVSSEIDISLAKNLENEILEHYRENPLVSQREALKEQHERKQQEKKNKSIKLILKIPKKNKDKKAVDRRGSIDKRPRGRPRKDELIESKKQSQKQKQQKQTMKKIKHEINIPEPEPEPIFEEPEVDNSVYCFCKQPSSGDMIGCDNETACPNGDWFHYKCVGLLNRVEALKYATGKQKWFCSDHCRMVVEAKQKKKKKRRNW